MESIDSFTLSRIQFAANITFHILFPSISIALAWFLLFFKIRYNKTKDSKWMDCYKFWVKVFALTFALGVVSGITMSFQFGTNWPGFMNTVGNIAGPLLAYEVLTAFFLEATFLGIMLFGFNRISNKVHTTATILVAFGTSMSAFWIMVLNSWMQTPAGYEMIDGKAHATDWLEIIFNPSMPLRLTHMLIASVLTVSFLIAGVSAFRILKGDKTEAVKSALKSAIIIAAIFIPIQIFGGDMLGLNTLKHQPAKIAAVETVWQTQKGAPLVLFAMPNEETKQNDYEIKIPKLASLILTHDFNGEIKGLNEFEGEHPPVAKVFWAFRIMVGTGVLMLAVSYLTLFVLWRKKNIGKIFGILLVAMTFSGWVATVAGWYVTEIGRQPWIVYGVLKTADAVAPIPTGMVLSSLIIYLVIYALLIVAYVNTIFHLARKATKENTPKPQIEDNLASQGAI
jgi:cytochrome d ubiquinol oxidase subunit I